MPATEPSKSTKDWAAAHSEADQQLKLIADLFDQVQKDVSIILVELVFYEVSLLNEEIFFLRWTNYLLPGR